MIIVDIPPEVFAAVMPGGSAARNRECEITARNIMAIRHRLGGKWKLTWREYRRERMKDGSFTEDEREYFDRVMPLIGDAIGAIAFSPIWAEAARNAVQL